MRLAISSSWKLALVATAVLQLWLAATATGPAVVLGLAGGILVLAAARVRHRWWSLALVAAGVLPFAITTWWSLATPLVAALAIGFATVPATRQAVPR